MKFLGYNYKVGCCFLQGGSVQGCKGIFSKFAKNWKNHKIRKKMWKIAEEIKNLHCPRARRFFIGRFCALEIKYWRTTTHLSSQIAHHSIRRLLAMGMVKFNAHVCFFMMVEFDCTRLISICIKMYQKKPRFVYKALTYGVRVATPDPIWTFRSHTYGNMWETVALCLNQI